MVNNLFQELSNGSPSNSLWLVKNNLGIYLKAGYLTFKVEQKHLNLLSNKQFYLINDIDETQQYDNSEIYLFHDVSIDQFLKQTEGQDFSPQIDDLKALSLDVLHKILGLKCTFFALSIDGSKNWYMSTKSASIKELMLSTASNYREINYADSLFIQLSDEIIFPV